MIETTKAIERTADPEMDLPSYFDGGLLGLIGINLLTVVLMIFTLGLAYPWATCLNLSWKTKHTIINGQRLKFTGTGLGLLSNWILWMFLSIITLGIYGFWVVIKLEKWKVAHTIFANIGEPDIFPQGDRPEHKPFNAQPSITMLVLAIVGAIILFAIYVFLVIKLVP